eukprot:TRINITY_DN66689_c6_g3_i1.p1 TRINITY_DN66689_c6_g3~~TRINITY_DN66689_c6_g3_i1.p1  ORF type:complete len:508 (-),score=98.04 TRINITY_DN66689_c6_g3_i1:472-1995(-)
MLHLVQQQQWQTAKQSADQFVDDKAQVDAFGNTALHLAILHKQLVLVHLLLDHGYYTSLRNKDGYNVTQLGCILGNKKLLAHIVKVASAHEHLEWQKKLPAVLRTLCEMPDGTMELHWAGKHPLPMINVFLPSDTFTIRKHQANIRIDFTFCGYKGIKVNRANQTLLIKQDDSGGASVFYLNHKKKQWEGGSDDEEMTDEEAMEVAEQLIKQFKGMFNIDVDHSSMRFIPDKKKNGTTRVETFKKWDCVVYVLRDLHFTFTQTPKLLTAPPPPTDANGITVNVPDDNQDTQQTTENLKQQKTDETTTSTTTTTCGQTVTDCVPQPNRDEDPQSAGNESSAGEVAEEQPTRLTKKEKDKVATDEEASEDGTKKTYKFNASATVWMTFECPFSMVQLLPMLEVVGPKNKHIKQLREILACHLPDGGFPAKTEIPLVAGLKAVVEFVKVEVHEINDSSLFAIPPNYKEWTKEDERAKRAEKKIKKKKESKQKVKEVPEEPEHKPAILEVD